MKSQTKKAYLAGPLAGIGMAGILLAKNWAVLAMGSAALVICLLMSILPRLKRTLPAAKPQFEVGPLLNNDPEKINKWLMPIAVFVLILGIIGFLISFGEEGSPQQSGYALFLIGIAIANFGICKANRGLIVAGFMQWFVAGAIVVFAALGIDDSFQMTRTLIMGGLLLLGGGLATYGFLFGKTRIYDEGILLSNRICPWQEFDKCEIRTINGINYLQVSAAWWKPLMPLRPDQVEPLKALLAEKLQDEQQ